MIVFASRFCFAALAAASFAWLCATPASAGGVTCKAEDFAAAVDAAGASLRAFNADNAPKLKSKLEQLRDKKGWPKTGYEDRAMEFLEDERVAALDTEANELLSRIDELGRPDPAQPPDCTMLAELKAGGAKLRSVMEEKSRYTLAKIDSAIGVEPAAKEKTAAAAKPPPAAQAARLAPPPPVAPATPPSRAQPGWDTDTVAVLAPEPGAGWNTGPGIEQGYTIDEIREVSRGFFGTISTELASVIEYAFAKSGRPAAYVLGTEGGGAFLAGLRYGKGTLYMRSGGTREVFWHGPSIGSDIGAEGARTIYLIYHLDRPEALFRRFGGIDGSAYFLGGVGLTLLKGGDVIMAPIRTGLGFRLGASIGYVRFTPRPTWNPF